MSIEKVWNTNRETVTSNKTVITIIIVLSIILIAGFLYINSKNKNEQKV